MGVAAIVGRDSVQVFLKAVSDQISPQPNHTRHQWAPWDAFVFVNDPDLLATEFTSRGVNFHKEIVDRGDGLRGFEVCDNDGYVLPMAIDRWTVILGRRPGVPRLVADDPGSL